MIWCFLIIFNWYPKKYQIVGLTLRIETQNKNLNL